MIQPRNARPGMTVSVARMRAMVVAEIWQRMAVLIAIHGLARWPRPHS